MESFTIGAVILRETQYKDNDAILTLLTAEKGIISALARGVLNIKSKNRSALQLFCYSELEIQTSGKQYFIKTATLKEQFYNVRNNMENFALACYVSDTACAFCTSESDETDAYRVVLNTLYALNRTQVTDKPIWLIKAAYELKLCSVCGFMPDLSACAVCGCDIKDGTDESIKNNQKYMFSLNESSLICNVCFEKERAKGNVHTCLKLTSSSLLAAKYICTSPIERFMSFKLTDDHSTFLCDFCEKYLLFFAERGFDTLKYYKSLINNN